MRSSTTVSESDDVSDSPPGRKSPGFKLPGLRWWMISVFMLGTVLNFLTRNTLSVAQVNLQDTLHITERQYSWITSAFQLTLMLQPICGYVLDTIGLRIGVAIFVLAWSVVSMAHALAGSWKGLARFTFPMIMC